MTTTENDNELYYIENDFTEDDFSQDHGNAVMGFMIAIPISIAFWAVLIFIVKYFL